MRTMGHDPRNCGEGQAESARGVLLAGGPARTQSGLLASTMVATLMLDEIRGWTSARTEASSGWRRVRRSAGPQAPLGAWTGPRPGPARCLHGQEGTLDGIRRRGTPPRRAGGRLALSARCRATAAAQRVTRLSHPDARPPGLGGEHARATATGDARVGSGAPAWSGDAPDSQLPTGGPRGSNAKNRSIPGRVVPGSWGPNALPGEIGRHAAPWARQTPLTASRARRITRRAPL